MGRIIEHKSVHMKINQMILENYAGFNIFAYHTLENQTQEKQQMKKKEKTIFKIEKAN